MRMWLAATRRKHCIIAINIRTGLFFSRPYLLIARISLGVPSLLLVYMARHLDFREGRLADSAGHTWSWSRRPHLPPDQAVRMMYERA